MTISGSTITFGFVRSTISRQRGLRLSRQWGKMEARLVEQ